MFYRLYKSVLSPDNGMNLYRGCTHGCIYCDSRSLCYRMDHDFEDIEVKKDAPLILERQLLSRRKKAMIGTGSMSDPYNPVEKEIEYTRKCLEVIQKQQFGISILTKSDLILRDMDLIEKINQDTKAVVQVTLTTADDTLCSLIEPNVANTSQRTRILEECLKHNIPTVVWLCPFLPFINDTEENIDALLDICVRNKVKGVIFFGIGLTLREGSREHFYQCLDRLFPNLKQEYQKRYANSYIVSSPHNDILSQKVLNTCRKNNILCDNDAVFAYLREYPQKTEQLSLF